MISKERIPVRIVKKIIHMLDEPMNLQKHAFGSKLLAICDGMMTVELAGVGRAKPMLDLVKTFIMALDSEATCECTLSDNKRCSKLEYNTMRRCMKPTGHSGKHKVSFCACHVVIVAIYYIYILHIYLFPHEIFVSSFLPSSTPPRDLCLRERSRCSLQL